MIVPINYSPLLSIEQQAALNYENRPKSYMNNCSGKLSNIQSDLYYHLHDLSKFHQVIINDLNKRNIDFDNEYKSFKEDVNLTESSLTGDDEERGHLEYVASQRQRAFHEEGMVIDRCKSYADEFSVVGMWATAEKYLGQVYKAIESDHTGTPISDITAPYRWNIIKSKFSEKSISLESLDGYADANECRVLNNAIKHSGFVNPQLAQFTFFTPLEGKELNHIDFEVQRYYNGIYSLLGDLIRVGNRALDPSFLF